jgi:lipoprotein-releasing system permease protein
MTQTAATKRGGKAKAVGDFRPFGAWERALAGRYLRTKRKNGGVALISIISFAGIGLAVAALVIIMSVMNGFRTDLLSKMLGFNGHVYVQGPAINGPGRDAMVSRIRAVQGVTEAVPKVEAQSFAIGPSSSSFAIVRGLTPADVKATRLVSDNIKAGSLKGFGEGDYGGDLILVGSRLADALGVTAGDEIALIAPSGGSTAMGVAPRRKTYTVGGIFSVGVSEYDQAFIYMPQQQAQLFFGRDGSIDEVEVKVDDPDRLDQIKPDILRAVGPDALVRDWRDRNHALFNALQVERTAMRLILMMVVAVVALNIISGLVMLVKNKARDIAILRTMGASRGAILRIFLMIGAAIGGFGTLAGLLLGVVFCIFIEPIQQGLNRLTGVNTFSSDVYFLSHIPAKIDPVEVTVIVVFSLAMSMLWALLPAIWASRLDPVEALRYE